MAEGIVIGNLTIPVIKGDKGDKGNTGEIISISLVLLSPSSTAYAINNGSTTQAQIELGIPKGLSVSTTNINASGELVFTFNDNSTVNVGQVVGKGISEITVTEEYDFVVTYTDGTSVTACNLEEEILGAINDILESYYTKTEIDEMGFITKEVNNLTNYTLKTSTGSSIELSINSSTYVMTLSLKNSAGTVISTGTVDLPLETMVVGATYDNTNKKIVLTLKNGSTIDVPVADLVSGLQSEITSSNKLSADLVDDTSTTHKFTSTSEKSSWNAKYDKPSGGIPSTDMSSGVQSSLGKADTALQEHQDISGKEDSSNKVTSIDENSTNTQYPSAKLVYDELVERDEEIEKLQTENAQLIADHPDITDTGTDLILNGTGDLKMKVDVGGNSTQEQYEGYNKLEGDTSYINTNIDSKTNVDLRILLSNTTIGSQDQSIVSTIISTKGRYYYTFTPNSNKVGMVIKHNGSQIDSRKNFSIELQSETTYTVSLDITGVNPTVQGGFSFKDVMVYQGTTEKPYEPYVGNQASPNPNYKQDINNVEGNVVVKGKNRQLFDKDNANILNGYFTPSDTTFVTNNAHRSVYIPCKSNTTYTVQKIATSRFRVGFTDILPANGVTITNSMPSSTNGENLTEVTATSGANSKYLIVWVYNSNTTSEPSFNNILNSLQIVEGSTAKPYTAYAENTATFPLSQGQKLMLGDTLEDDGIHHKRRQTTFTGTTVTLSNAKTNGAYLCDQKTSGNLNGQTLTFDNAVTNAIIEYELATETTEAYTSAQQTAYNKLKEMQSYYDLTYVVGSSNNAQPILTVQAKKSLKVINDEISNINSRLTLLEE